MAAARVVVVMVEAVAVEDSGAAARAVAKAAARVEEGAEPCSVGRVVAKAAAEMVVAWVAASKRAARRCKRLGMRKRADQSSPGLSDGPGPPPKFGMVLGMKPSWHNPRCRDLCGHTSAGGGGGM